MGIKLCEIGRKRINEMRKQKGWNKLDPRWCKEANVSESTLKRFWGMTKGDGVAPDTFKAICQAVGVDDVKEVWKQWVPEDNTDSTRVPDLTEGKEIYTLIPESGASRTKFTVTIKGIGLLNENEILQVEVNLDYLKNVLTKPHVNFSIVEEANISDSESTKKQYLITVTGVGVFDKDQKLLVEVTLKELKDFLRNPYVRMQPVCEREVDIPAIFR